MDDKLLQQLTYASDCVANEEVIAYPTETVFGLGCDPLSELAVKKLLKLKNRDWQKGLIVIAANSSQLAGFFSPEWLQWLDKKQPQQPTTYLIPCLPTVPNWLRGNHKSLAVRLVNNEITNKLCKLAGPLVSTSANKKGSDPLLDSDSVRAVFQNQLDCIVSGRIFSKNTSSQIIDAVSGNILR